MALVLLGNPAVVYSSNKMALLLHGNPTRVYPSNQMAILLLGFARFKKCENKAIMLLGMMGIPSVFRAIILLPVLLGRGQNTISCQIKLCQSVVRFLH